MASNDRKHSRTTPIFTISMMVDGLDQNDDATTIQRVAAEVSRVMQHANSIVDLARDHKSSAAREHRTLDICPTCVGIGTDIGECADCRGLGIEAPRRRR